MSWSQVAMGQFLKARETRFKPNDKAIKHLKRIDKIDFSGRIFISDKVSNTDMILIKKGDLVISGINVEKGAMSIYRGEEDIIATIHYSSYEFDENRIDIEFLNHFLKSLEFRKVLKEQVPGGIKTEIKPKHLSKLLINIPTDVEHQRAIIVKLKQRNEKVNLICSEIAHQFNLVGRLRKQILQDAIQGKLVEQYSIDEPASLLLKRIKAEKAQLIRSEKLRKEKDLPPIKPEEIPFQIPTDWVWCRLGDVIELVSGQDLTPKEYSSTDTTGVPYITGASNLIGGNVIINRWTKTPRSYSLAGDLLLTCKGSGIGKMAYLTEEKVHIARQIMAIRSSFILLNYAELILLTNVDYFRKNAKSLIPGIDRLQVLSLLLPLPSINEQHRIVQKLNQLMQTCNTLENSLKQSEQQNKQLSQQILREALSKEAEPETVS
jgi:type I restriction enzyme S subunit